jgi:alanine racemase
MSTDSRSRAWVDVSIRAFQENFLTIREAVGADVRIIPMVKANAYGLGLFEALDALEPLEPWGYGVAAVEEGIRIRERGIEKPVLVLSPLPPASYRPAVEAGLSVCISDTEALERLEAAAEAVERPGGFHLEVDTGMGRAGFAWDQVDRWGPAFRARLGAPLRWDGSFTHFHSADVPGESTGLQWSRLRRVLDVLPPMPPGAILHACNSPGSLRRPDFAADAVRPGIFLYGGVAGDALPPPAPVAALRARVTFLRDAREGNTVGYGATYTAAGPERWATVGIGYGDGLPRLLSNRGQALIRGRRVPIIGRISMDATVLNVTGVDGVETGDVVTFFGRAGEEHIPVEEVAGHAATINYEILTDLTTRVPRIWTTDGGY